jgi:DNA-binding NtrC family response regulator
VTEGSPERVEELSERGLPVLATCAGDDMEALSAFARAGAADILTHPLVIDDLIRKLDRALKRARRRD